MSDLEAFCEPRHDGDRVSFQPGDRARGPWGEDSLHGRIIAGLFAREFERLHGDPDLQLSRLTVDLFRLPRLDPLSADVEVIRQGRRIRVLAGTMRSGGVEVARATAVLLRRSEAPPGVVWQPEPWDVPRADQIEPDPSRGEGPGWIPGWEMRGVRGPIFTGRERKQAWLRDTR